MKRPAFTQEQIEYISQEIIGEEEEWDLHTMDIVECMKRQIRNEEKIRAERRLRNP